MKSLLFFPTMDMENVSSYRLVIFCEGENFRMSVSDQQDFHTMLLELLPSIKGLFMKKWGKSDYHAFCKENCTTTIILDGYQKNYEKSLCSQKNVYSLC